MINCHPRIPTEGPLAKPPIGSWGHSPSLQKGKRYLPVGRARVPSSRFRQGGFTLVELLFVVLLLGTVMTVIMACFEGGLRVYDRVRNVGPSEIAAYLAGETLSRDLKNGIQSDALPLTGDAQALEFMTMATVGRSAGQRLQVRYEADASGLLRLAATAENPAAGVSESVRTERLLDENFVITLRYQDRADGAGDRAWRENWTSSSNLPVAVQLEIGGEALTTGPVLRTVMLETATTEEP